MSLVTSSLLKVSSSSERFMDLQSLQSSLPSVQPASRQLASGSSSAYPRAFLCTRSQTIMQDPVLALCGHLFDRSVLAQTKLCPIDGSPIEIEDAIYLHDLKRKISERFPMLADFQKSAASSSQEGSSSTEESKREISPQRESYADRVASKKIQNQGNGARVFSSQSFKGSEKEEEAAEVRPFLRVENSHRDDIHGFLPLSQTTFVSGSKDNTMKVWSKETGELKQTLVPSESEGGYEFWVTALAKVQEHLWSCGTRDGRVILWNFSGNEVATLRYSPKAQNICKERNKTRINCIAPLQSTDASKVTFYTGVPEYVYLWEHKVGTNAISHVCRYFAKRNDWVYCIEALENRDLLVVIGSDFEYWKMKKLDVADKFSLIEEAQERKKQRPHISAIARLTHNTRHVASALFDGSVKVIDIDRSTVVRDYQEHKRRVWSVLDLQPHVFASSADDRTIKIWDVRQEKSGLTLGGNPGRVSSLAKLSEHVFISGSCPDNIKYAVDKASISFWDIRQVVKRCMANYGDYL